MTTEASKKRNKIIAWMLLLIGLVLAGDGLLQLAANNSERMGEATLGGFMLMLSGVFFFASRKSASAPKSNEAVEEE